MTITAQHVEAVLRRIPGAYGRQVTSLAILADGANEALRTAPPGLTVQGAAAFLATMAQESASFRATEEYAKNGRYAPYIGRSFEMVTWKANYRVFGYWCLDEGLVTDPEVFVKTPRTLANIRWAWLGGVWFWEPYGIWAYANRGDFLAVSRIVNLGNANTKATPVGMNARTAWYKAWLTIGTDLLPEPTPTPSPNPTTERPIDMSTAENKYVNFAGAQPLAVGDNEVKINEKAEKTLASGPNDGVDLLATIDIRDAQGRSYTGRVVPNPAYPTDPAAAATSGEPPFITVGQPRSFFRVVSWKDGTPTVTASSRRPSLGDQISYKGTVAADKTAGRSARVRLIINIPNDAPAGLVLKSVQVSGWTL